MQPGPPPEELQAILSRFHTWAENNQPNGNGNGQANGLPAEEIREIPYEEAIRQHRSRQAARTQRRPTAKAKASPLSESRPTADPAVSLTERQEDLPSWAANLPVVPETEPVIHLETHPETRPPLSPPASGPHQEATQASARTPAPQRVRKSLPARKRPVETIESVLAAALPALPALSDLPARGVLDPPPASLASRPRPRTPSAPKLGAKAAVEAPLPPPTPALLAPSARRAAAGNTKPAARAAAATAKSASRPHPRSNPNPNSVAARIQPRAGVIGSPVKTMVSAAVPRAALRRAAPTAKPIRRAPTKQRFSQILASTVQPPKTTLASKKKLAQPDRIRRITTRFSRGEERRIEKCAAGMGITVSAYLRECALSAVAHDPPLDLPVLPAPLKTRKASRPATPPPAFTTYTPPAPSLFGGWLSLLRNRFLGPPIRLSEDA